MEQFEFEDIFTGHLVQTSIAMSRDISNYKRLLRLQSNLTSNVSRDGVYTTSLGNLLQGHTILIVRYSFLISNQSWPSVCLKPLPPVLLQQTLTKCLSSSVSQSSFNYSKTTVGFPQSLLFCSLKNPNFPHRRDISSLRSSSWLSSGFIPTGTCHSCAEDIRAGFSIPGGVSQEWRELITSHRLVGHIFFWCSSGCGWLSGLQIQMLCWLKSTLSCTRTHKSFSAELFSIFQCVKLLNLICIRSIRCPLGMSYCLTEKLA